MLAQNNCCSEFVINSADGSEKFMRRNRVKLTCRLIQYKHTRLHYHYRSKVKELLLSARKLIGFLMKPALYSEKRRHFRHLGAYLLRFHSEAFKPERQLVPYLIRYNLIIRILHHKSDFRCLHSFAHALYRHIIIQYFTRHISVRRNRRLKHPKQSCFSAARFAANRHKLTAFYRKSNIIERVHTPCRIGKAQIFDFIYFHFITSVISAAIGIDNKMKYAKKTVTPYADSSAPCIYGKQLNFNAPIAAPIIT